MIWLWEWKRKKWTNRKTTQTHTAICFFFHATGFIELIERWMSTESVLVSLMLGLPSDEPFLGSPPELPPIILPVTWFVASNPRQPAPNLNPINHPTDHCCPPNSAEDAVRLDYRHHSLDFWSAAAQHFRHAFQMRLPKKWNEKHFVVVWKWIEICWIGKERLKIEGIGCKSKNMLWTREITPQRIHKFTSFRIFRLTILIEIKQIKYFEKKWKFIFDCGI